MQHNAPGIKINNFDQGAYTAKIQNLTLRLLPFSPKFQGPSMDCPNLLSVGYWTPLVFIHELNELE